MRSFSDMRVVWIGLVVVVGCGKKTPEGDPHAGSGSGSASTGSDSGSGSEHVGELANDPTMALVTKAFGGKLPPFPLLNGSGMAAIGLEAPVGASDVSTYSVAFLSGWSGSADAWGSMAQAVPVFDPTMAKMVLDTEMGETAPAPDTTMLATRASAISKRLADEHFTKFDGPTAKLSVGETAVGPAKVKITRDQEGGIAVEIAGPNSILPPHPIKPFLMGHVADVDCVSQPVPRTAWYDTARKILLVEIGWNAGPDMCNAPDPEMGVIAVP